MGKAFGKLDLFLLFEVNDIGICLLNIFVFWLYSRCCWIRITTNRWHGTKNTKRSPSSTSDWRRQSKASIKCGKSESTKYCMKKRSPNLKMITSWGWIGTSRKWPFLYVVSSFCNIYYYIYSVLKPVAINRGALLAHHVQGAVCGSEIERRTRILHVNYRTLLFAIAFLTRRIF